MKRILTSVIIAVLCSAIYAKAYTSTEISDSKLVEAGNSLESFQKRFSAGQPDASCYQSLYRAFELYSAAVENTVFGSPDYNTCKQALCEIFPRLADGAYFYAALNNQIKVLEFACAYIDVSLLNCMAKENCQNAPQYPVLANLAAINLYNRRQYERSITYFSAYLESGDVKARENAFEGLVRCLFETKDYGRAAGVCFRASEIYPQNMNILLIGIESCGYNGNDREMEQMLQKALALQPNHKGLLEYQGKMYERMNRYEDAARSYSQLCAVSPDNLDYNCHLGFDYYNAATLAYTLAKTNDTPTDTAIDLFGRAAPYLRNVLDSSPYAANVARALAFCYSLTKDATRLSEANRTLASLHSQTVDLSALPTLVQNYTPSPELNPVSASFTAAVAKGEDTLISDVDINIPETGLKNPNTYVVIIANENYKNVEVQTVDFAHRDGNIFGEYCNKVLGIPKDNIKIIHDATASEMRSHIRFLDERTAMEPDKLDVIFYYAGHGAPDVANNKSYLVPTDVQANDFDECYPLDKLYAGFDAMKARNVTVFLDACFSGATRSGRMITSGRYVRKNQADIKPSGKTVVFSATSADEAASAYKDNGHGYFTYFLLKALQETRGGITLSELRDRLEHDVKTKAYDLERKKQTPTMSCPDELLMTLSTRRLTD